MVDGNETKSAGGRVAVAFAFVAGNTGAAERRFGPDAARDQHAAAFPAGCPPDDDPAEACASRHSPDHLGVPH
jgi:hypothetical protein